MVLILEREQNTFDKFCKKEKIRQSVTPENIFSSKCRFGKDCFSSCFSPVPVYLVPQVFCPRGHFTL